MRAKHKQFVDEKMALIGKTGLVVDIGGGSRFQKWLGEYEHLFSDTDYQTMDYNESTNPDIVGDIHNLPFDDMSLDAIICAHVLEHVRDPIRAAEEMYRVLKPGGLLFLYVPSIHPYHARPGAYPDYWRFFEDTLTELLKDFTTTEIVEKGGYFTALSTFVPFRRHVLKPLEAVASLLDRLVASRKSPTTEGFFTFSIK